MIVPVKRRLCYVTFLLFTAALMSTQIGAAVTIEYMSWAGGPERADAHQREVEAFYAKYPDSDIVIETQFTAWDEYRDKLFVQASAGALPDIMMVPNGFWPEMAAMGYYLELDPFIEKDPSFDLGQLSTDVANIMRVNGRLYTLPTGGFAPTGAMVSLNLDLIEAAGLATPSYDWTWDDYLDYAKKLTRSRGGDQISQWGSNLAKTTWSGGWAMHIASNGGHLVDPQGQYIVKPVLEPNRLRLTSPEVEAAFQYFKDLADVHNVVLPEGLGASEAFAAGQLAMQNVWSGTARDRLTSGDVRAGVTTTPMGKGGNHGVWPHVGLPHVYAISSQTEDPEAAWQVLSFLVASEEALQARRTDGLASIAYGRLIPVYEELVRPEWRPWLDIGRRYLERVPPEGNELWKTLPGRAVDALMEEVQKAYNNEQSVRSALEEAQRRATQIMIEEARNQ